MCFREFCEIDRCLINSRLCAIFLRLLSHNYGYKNMLRSRVICLQQTLFSLILTISLVSPTVAQDFKIMTEELKPFGYVDNGEIKGVCVEIVREVLKVLGHPDDIKVYPWDRAYLEVSHEPGRILFAMGRNEAREGLFKWVGPLISNVTYLYKHRGSPVLIHNLEEARSVRMIAVRENFFAHTQLQAFGFNNLYLSREEELDLKMLAADRVDLAAFGELSLPAACEGANVDCSLIENTGVMIYDSKLYIAFSLQTDDKEIQLWQSALDQVKASPVFSEIIARYIQPPTIHQ